MSNDVLLRLDGICKSFGATRALHEVNLDIKPGRVHALIGENGAGKSTLMKVLSGAYQADRGTIYLDGKPVVIDSPLDGRGLGVAMVYQELNLAPHLSVEENLTLGMEKSRLGIVQSQREKILPALELLQHPDLNIKTPVRELSIGLQQVVEIARGLVCNARVIIMDEPTSSLTAADTRALFEAIKRLKESGIAIIYISHFLEEVQEIADDYTVLRDGETVGTGLMSEVTIERIIELMVGRTLNEMFPKIPHEMGEVFLRVEGMDGAVIPKCVTFELHRGEILGIGGLVGSGRSEVIRGIFGLHAIERGGMTITGSGTLGLNGMTPGKALRARIDLLSEDRKAEGLAVGMSIAENTTMSSIARFAGWGGKGFLNLRKEQEAVRHWIKEMNIRCQGPNQRVVDLSGGNQQKVAMGRILEQGGDILLLDEPTRGIDVGSKVEIYRLAGRLAAEGKAIVFVSSYLPELFGICDTLAVMHRGKMSPIRPIAEWTEQDVMQVATSGN